MAKLDYVAHDDEGRAQQFIVFRDNIGQFVVPLGIQPADPRHRSTGAGGFSGHHATGRPRLDR